MENYTHITVDEAFQGRIVTITLQRPEVHNALNTELILELTQIFQALASNQTLHGIVLAGAGRSFSAGADIHMMKAAIHHSVEENIQEAQQLATLLETIETHPCPVVARVQGAAIGGATGLIAACDITLAEQNTRFAFSEVRLGLAPAVIAPYVIRKIGVGHARALFTTGERFNAQRAYEIGLLHKVAPSEQLDQVLHTTLQDLLNGAPQALRACKLLARTVDQQSDAEPVRDYTKRLIANLRRSKEGQEGLNAFLEKRNPYWKVE